MKELIDRFVNARKTGAFPLYGCELEDLLLLAVSRVAPASLSSGELSCIAVVYRVTTLALMTDEKAARSFTREKLGLRVETTPRLYGWLHFKRILLDSDHAEIIAEHERYERRPLTNFFHLAYESALQYRLMQTQLT